MYTNEQYTCLVKKYIDTVFRIALNYTKSVPDAEDVTQNVFLALLRQKQPFDGEEHIRNWLIHVAVNECKKWHRSPWRHHISFDGCPSALPDTAQRDLEILESVMALPRKYRMPIYLYYYEEYTTQEIAQILKIPKGTVCTYLNRGRELLKISFEEDEDHE